MATRTIHEQGNSIAVIGPFVFSRTLVAATDSPAFLPGFTASYTHLVKQIYASFISSLTVYVNSPTTAKNTTFSVFTTTDADISAGNPPVALAGISVVIPTVGSGYVNLPIGQIPVAANSWLSVSANCGTAGILKASAFIVLGI